MYESYKIGAYHRTENKHISVDRHVNWNIPKKGSYVKGEIYCPGLL